MAQRVYHLFIKSRSMSMHHLSMKRCFGMRPLNQTSVQRSPSRTTLTLYHILTSSSSIRVFAPFTLSLKISSLFCGASPFHPSVEVSSRGNPICSTMNDDDTVAYNAAIDQCVSRSYLFLTYLRMGHLLIGVVQRRILLDTSSPLFISFASCERS